MGFFFTLPATYEPKFPYFTSPTNLSIADSLILRKVNVNFYLEKSNFHFLGVSSPRLSCSLTIDAYT